MKTRFIKQKLKDQINNFEIDENLLNNIKTNCFIPQNKVNKKDKKKISFFCIFSALVCAVASIVICLTLFLPSNTNITDTYVSIAMMPTTSTFSERDSFSTSQPPAIEILVDKNNVATERGLNSSAVILLAASKQTNETFEDCLQNIIHQAKNLGYLEKYSLKIITTNLNSKNTEKKVIQQIEKELVLLQNSPLYDFEFEIQIDDNTNEYNIHNNLYNLIVDIQKKFGGEIEDYLEYDYQKLVELLYDYDQIELDNLKEELDREINLMEEFYQIQIKNIENLIDISEQLIDKIEELIDSYEREDFQTSSIMQSILTKQLESFIQTAQIFFDEINIDNLFNELDKDNIQNFLTTFELCSEEIEDKLDSIEDEIEDKILEIKKKLINRKEIPTKVLIQLYIL